MNILKAIAKFIGWLSGSLAGIGAIFAVCGYLITIANLHLLGLDIRILDYNTEYYLRRGGNFFFYLVSLMGEKILLPLLVIMLIVSVIFLLFYVVITKSSVYKHFVLFWNRILNIKSEYSPVFRALIFIFMVILFIYQLGPRLELFITPLKISNLLYDIDETDTNALKSSIKRSILSGETKELAFRFYEILMSVVMAGLLLFVVWRVTLTWPLRIILVSPFVVIFILYLLFLPMVYGVLILTPEFPPIAVSSKNEMISNQSIGGSVSKIVL